MEEQLGTGIGIVVGLLVLAARHYPGVRGWRVSTC